MPRPNPIQTRNLDAVTLRRELKQMIPGTIAFDREELRELLDFSNVGGCYDVLRRKLLSRAISQLGSDDLLSESGRAALIAYRMGEGPRPSFVRLVNSGGHFAGESILDPTEQRAEATAPALQEDPSEPGRYVQPIGRFAVGGKDDRWGD